MNIIADLIRAGTDPELVAGVAEAIAQARAEGAREAGPTRSKKAERQARWRAKTSTNRLQTVYNVDDVDASVDACRRFVDAGASADPLKKKKSLPPAPPSKENPTLPPLDSDRDSSGRESPSPSNSSPDGDGALFELTPSEPPRPTAGQRFEEFWQAYPRKTAKQAAKTAFLKIAKDRTATFEQIMQGLARYTAHIERQGADVKICHGATWINGRRWEDEYEGETSNVVPMRAAKLGLSDEDWKRRVANIGDTADHF